LDSPDEILAPFIEAVATTLREMAGVDVVVRDSFRADGDQGLADVSAVLRLIAGTEGRLVLSFPRGTATALAGRVLADAGGELTEEMIRDCVAELLNVVAGQAKALLFGTARHFTLATPTILTDVLLDTGGRFVVRFDSDVGEFNLHLNPALETAGTGEGKSSRTGLGG
jgi:chemotaxis protein CheX